MGGHAVEVSLEVADDPVHPQPVVLVGELLRGVADDLLGDVERDVAAQRPLAGHRVEQDPRFVGRARAELDELAGAGLADDLAGPKLEDLAL